MFELLMFGSERYFITENIEISFELATLVSSLSVLCPIPLVGVFIIRSKLTLSSEFNITRKYAVRSLISFLW